MSVNPEPMCMTLTGRVTQVYKQVRGATGGHFDVN